MGADAVTEISSTETDEEILGQKVLGGWKGQAPGGEGRRGEGEATRGEVGGMGAEDRKGATEKRVEHGEGKAAGRTGQREGEEGGGELISWVEVGGGPEGEVEGGPRVEVEGGGGGSEACGQGGVGLVEGSKSGGASKGGAAKGRSGERVVCVTGGTGYIALCLIRRLLQLGYTVRATVRNPDDEKKTAILWKMEAAKERLSLVAADLMQEGSFDAAVEGVEGVFHTAGPVRPDSAKGDPQVLMIDPCVKGTLNVLRSCTKSSTVKRVVMTSSCSALRYDFNRKADDSPLDEQSWSNSDYCRDNQMWYALAKIQAEQKAWKFAQEHNLNLVVVNPSFVVGPFIGAFPTSTASYILSLLQGKTDEYPNQIIGFVHIDDVVTAHILVYEKTEANGRYICSSVVTHWFQILNMIRFKYSTLKIPTRRREGNAEAVHHTMTTDKIEQLGLTSFKSADSMFDDCIQDFICKGLLQELP